MSPWGSGPERVLGRPGALFGIVLVALIVLTQVTLPVVDASPMHGEVVLEGTIVLDAERSYGPSVQVTIGPGTTIMAAAGQALVAKPVLIVEGPLIARGTPEAQIRVEVPVVATASTAPIQLSNVSFNGTGGEACSLTLGTDSAVLRNIRVKGGRAGICVGAPAARRPVSPTETFGAAEPAPWSPPYVVEASHALIQPASAAPVGYPPGFFWPPGDGPAAIDRRPNGIRMEHVVISGTAVGMELGPGAPTVTLENATLRSNGVGLWVEGGRAVMDHVWLGDNHVWDIWSVATTNVVWSASHGDVACVKIEGRKHHGCERGSIAQSLPVFLAGIGFLIAGALAILLSKYAVIIKQYSRLRKDEILQQARRAKLFEIVRSTPGIHQRALVGRVAHVGATTYHLQMLERFGYLVSRADGSRRRYYLPRDIPEAAAAPSTRQQILEVIEETPGIHQAAVADSLGFSPPKVGYHVRRLRAEGRVAARPDGRRLALRVIRVIEAVADRAPVAGDQELDDDHGPPPDLPVESVSEPAARGS